jgi:hypothetical protein
VSAAPRWSSSRERERDGGGDATALAGEAAADRAVLVSDCGLVCAAIAQDLGDRVLAPADGDLERGEAVRVGRVDRRSGVEQRRDRPRRPPAPDRFVEVSSYLREGDNVFETDWTNGRGVEAMDNSYGLMDLTVYGRQESWEDSPPGWPQQWQVDRSIWRTNGRPTAQWSRIQAGRSDDLGNAVG